jgi:hypothetical protein
MEKDQIYTAEDLIAQNTERGGYGERIKFDPNKTSVSIRDQRAKYLSEHYGVNNLDIHDSDPFLQQELNRQALWQFNNNVEPEIRTPLTKNQ